MFENAFLQSETIYHFTALRGIKAGRPVSRLAGKPVGSVKLVHT